MMRKALVALVGTVVVGGVLLSPAPAAAKTKVKAKEFLFQGGDDAFGTAPVGMSMTGRDFGKPKRLTGFALGGPVTYECPLYGDDGNSVSGWHQGDPLGPEAPSELWTFPIDQKPKAAAIKTHKKKGFNFFEWEYASYPDAYPIYLYDIKGVQSRKNPRLWGGELSIRHIIPEAIGTADPYCRLADVGGTAADEGVLTWRARLVKACPGQCESPFQRTNALVVGQ